MEPFHDTMGMIVTVDDANVVSSTETNVTVVHWVNVFRRTFYRMTCWQMFKQNYGPLKALCLNLYTFK